VSRSSCHAADRRRRDPNPPKILAGLYVRWRPTSSQIGLVPGIPDRTSPDRLRQHGIQLRTRGSWDHEDRRTRPAETACELYSQAGLNHIELLTGQPAQTVRGFVRRAGIPTRRPGGRSPFIRRRRAATARPRC